MSENTMYEFGSVPWVKIRGGPVLIYCLTPREVSDNFSVGIPADRRLKRRKPRNCGERVPNVIGGFLDSLILNFEQPFSYKISESVLRGSQIEKTSESVVPSPQIVKISESAVGGGYENRNLLCDGVF